MSTVPSTGFQEPVRAETSMPGSRSSAEGSRGLTWAQIQHLAFILFFVSGLTSLAYETIFFVLLRRVFGVTAYATSAVITAFLAGLALGSYAFGGWARRWQRLILAYGIMELVIGGYCFLAPQLLGRLPALYSFLYTNLHFSLVSITAARFFLSFLVLIVPSFLMGGTLPVLTQYLVRSGQEIDWKLPKLYTINTLGGALGVFATTYFFFPQFGIQTTLKLMAILNVAIFAAALVLDRARRGAVASANVEAEPRVDLGDATESQPRSGRILLVCAFLGGCLALFYEVLWTHVLAMVLGNSVYAFGLMLGTFLLGLAWGGLWAARRGLRGKNPVYDLAFSQIAVGAIVILTLPIWAKVSLIYARSRPFHRVILTFIDFTNAHRALAVLLWGLLSGVFIISRRGQGVVVRFLISLLALPALFIRPDDALFISSELLRFLVCFGLIILPATALGVALPLMLRLFCALGNDLSKRVGKMYAFNTVGAVLGSCVMGFLLLPRLLSDGSMRLAGALTLALGLSIFLLLANARPASKAKVSLSVAALALVGIFAVPKWDLAMLNTGSYVYFDPVARGRRVIFHREDITGGSTAVVQQGDSLTLLTNGKFQGNNSSELGAQERFAHVPMLFCRRADQALVIGLGTGTTLGTLAHYPFRRIVVAELSPNIVLAARTYFSDINHGVLDQDPRVDLKLEDGRNYLLLTGEKFDLITIELSSIWISGAADLYNREFYQLCSRSLNEAGILQQWVQLHHMRKQDLLTILNTARSVFPHVAFFFGGQQGYLIASRSPLESDYQALQRWNQSAGFTRALRTVPFNKLFSLFGDLILDSNGVERVLREHVPPPQEGWLSTDANCYLEYATPRGNFINYDSIAANLNFLAPYLKQARPTIRNIPSESEKLVIEACALTERGLPAMALSKLQRIPEGERSAEARQMVAFLSEKER